MKYQIEFAGMEVLADGSGLAFAIFYGFYQSWALSVFFYFFTDKKLFFAFFIKLIWLEVGFLNMTGAEVGY